MPIVLAKIVSLHYPKMRTKASTGHFMRYLYWTAAGITFLINIGYTTQSLRHQYTRNHPSITSCIIQLPNHPCTIPSGTSVYNDEIPAVISSHTCIMEYSDCRTTPYHDCYPTGRTATNPPASYYRVYNNFATNNIWFSTHCCLCAVSVSTTKKEKFPEQFQVLWKYVCVLCRDYCNHWTHPHTADPV